MSNQKLAPRLCGICILLGISSAAWPAAAKPPDNQVATLSVKLIDSERKPVEGAEVGFGIRRTQTQREGEKIKDTGWILYGPEPTKTNKDGIAQLQILISQIPHFSVVARQHDRKLIGIAKPEPSWSEKPGVISLEPECRVKFQLICPELESRKGRTKSAAIGARRVGDGPKVVTWMDLVKLDGIFDFPAPPGSFELTIERDGTEPRDFKLTVARGQRELDLGSIKLSATKLALIEDRPAPEFQDVVAWVNSRALNIAKLKGKVVLLDFWGYWCGGCVQIGIPELISLHDELHKQGLVIIAVHVSRNDARNDERVDSPEKLEAKISKIRTRCWKGRSLPFPVALAVSKRTPSRDGLADAEMDSQIATDYGVTLYPTTILIDREGKVAGYSVGSPMSAKLQEMLVKLLPKTNGTDARMKRLKASLSRALIAMRALGQRTDPDFDVSVPHPAYTGKHPAVLFDEAHENFHTAGGGYKGFADLITNDGYRVTPNREPFTAERLARYDLLVSANAAAPSEASTSAFTKAECDSVENWVRGGGALLLITDHEPYGSGSEELGKRFGVNMSLRVTRDPANQTDIGLLFSRDKNQLGDHPILRGRNESERVNRVLTFVGQSLKGPPGSAPLLKFADTAMDVRQDKRISAAGRAQGIAFKFGRGRVVVMGEAGELSAQVYGDPPEQMGMNVPGCDNRKMALNIVHWLSGLID